MYNAVSCVIPVPCVLIIAWMTMRVIRKVSLENGDVRLGERRIDVE